MTPRARIWSAAVAAVAVIAAVTFLVPVAPDVPPPTGRDGKNRDTVPSSGLAEYGRRVESMRRSVAEDSMNAPHIIALARMYMDGHRNADAVRYFHMALRREPGNEEVLLDLAVCYVGMSEYGKALVVTDELLKRRPDHPKGLYNRGAILASTGRPDEAVAVWKKVIRLSPGSEAAASARAGLSKVSNGR